MKHGRHFEDPQTLGTTKQSLVIMVTWHSGFVHPWALYIWIFTWSTLNFSVRISFTGCKNWWNSLISRRYWRVQVCNTSKSYNSVCGMGNFKSRIFISITI